jgi:iron complex transport system substrate-binding protein
VKRFSLCAIVLLFFAPLSCTGERGSAPPERGGSAASGKISVIDDEGRAVVFDEPCGRIISLYSAHTENLFAIGAGPAVIGVQNGADYPAETAALPRFDYNGDPEYIIAAGPDLVLIRPFVRRQSPAYIAELEMAGIAVVSLYPESFDDFDAYIRRLGLLSGRDAEAEERLAAFHRSLDGIAARSAQAVKKRTVFFEATENEIRTAASGSLPARAIAFSGGINAAPGAEPMTPGSSIARFGAERLLGRAGEIDVYVVQQGAMNPVAGIAALRARPGFSALKAVREGNVLFVNEKIISSPTFRYLEGVALLARFLYPDLFDVDNDVVTSDRIDAGFAGAGS